MLVELLLALAIPLGLDLYLPVPEDNPLTVEKVGLGRRLFFDRRLSANGSISCATCHDPRRAFSSNRRVAVGVFGRSGRRNAPAIINRAYGFSFFWDGQTTSLEAQVLKPIEDPAEMGSSAARAARRAGVTRAELARALASYVRSILSGNSPFDRYIAGDRSALNGEEVAGLRLFRGKGNCTACHVGPLLSDEQFHNTGAAWVEAIPALQFPVGGGASPFVEPRPGTYRDAGRFMVTGRDSDRGAFKTPTLREVARTAPYMHDGSLRSLDEVIAFYDRGGRANPRLDVEIRPLRLSELEKRQLTRFLRTLSADVQEGGPTPATRAES
jgi:cytochrome c peroxidase